MSYLYILYIFACYLFIHCMCVIYSRTLALTAIVICWLYPTLNKFCLILSHLISNKLYQMCFNSHNWCHTKLKAFPYVFIIQTLDISPSNITRYWTQHDRVKAKSLFRPWTHAWWRHQMATFSTLLAICAGNSPVPGELPAQRPVTRNFDAFFDLRSNKLLSKQSWGWWFETPSRPLWRHRNGKTPP